MRPISFHQKLPGEKDEKWMMRCLRQIEEHSNEDALPIADQFTVKPTTKTRTLDAGTATLSDVVNFLATFIDDLQKRGKNRAQ